MIQTEIVNLDSFRDIVENKTKKNVRFNKKCWSIHEKRLCQTISTSLDQVRAQRFKFKWRYENCLWELKYQMREKEILRRYQLQLYNKIHCFFTILKKGDYSMLYDDILVHIIEYIIH